MSTTWSNLGLGLLQSLTLIGAAPLLVGLLRWFKARWQGYQGATPIQPYRDIVKLWRKPAMRPAGTSFVFAATPYLLFALYGAVACTIPLFGPQTLLAADLILIIYLLALARFILSLSGLDTGASFGGLGSSREMFFYFLTEIGLAVVVAGLAIRWRTTDLTAILQTHWSLGFNLFGRHPELILLAFAFAFLILFEAERLPLDNPATHLELTMAQHAVTLEFAGRDLAILEWAEMVKLSALLTLYGAMFLPFASVFFVFILVVALAAWELSQVKLRLRVVVGPTLTAVVVSLAAILFALTLGSS